MANGEHPDSVDHIRRRRCVFKLGRMSWASQPQHFLRWVFPSSASEWPNFWCAAAADTALRLPGRCELVLKRPLRVAIEDEFDHPHPLIGLVFGVFDPVEEQTRIARPASIRTVPEGTPFAALPINDLSDSVTVHGIVHGVMHQ